MYNELIIAANREDTESPAAFECKIVTRDLMSAYHKVVAEFFLVNDASHRAEWKKMLDAVSTGGEFTITYSTIGGSDYIALRANEVMVRVGHSTYKLKPANCFTAFREAVRAMA